MDTSFNQTAFNLAYSDGVENNYWNIARNNILLNAIRKNNFTQNNIIEIGCGRGIVVKFLMQHQINCFGLELAEVNPVAGTNIITGKNAVDMSEEFKLKFKTLLLLDVIEHIEHPVEFMNDILTNYKNVDSLIITVPARQELWSNYDEFYGHFKRYDLKTLQTEVEATGFEIKQLGYFFHTLYIPAKIVVKFMGKREIKMNVPTGVSAFIHKLVAGLMIIESKLLPSKMHGTSVLCVATKGKKLF